MLENVYMKALMLENVYEGLNDCSEVYLSTEYFGKMYPTCVSSKLCEFIHSTAAVSPKPNPLSPTIASQQSIRIATIQKQQCYRKQFKQMMQLK